MRGFFCAEHLGVILKERAKLPDLVVPFKRQVYLEVVAAFREFAAE